MTYLSIENTEEYIHIESLQKNRSGKLRLKTKIQCMCIVDSLCYKAETNTPL